MFARNPALTMLMRRLGRLVWEAAVNGNTDALSYDAVLSVFDDALACPDSCWPPGENDGPLEFILPDEPPHSRTAGEEEEAAVEAHPTYCRHRRKQEHGRADKDKQRATEEPDVDSECDGDDCDGLLPWDETSESDVDALGLATGTDDAEDYADYEGLCPPASDGCHPVVHDDEDEDRQDAADVSAMLGYDADVDDSPAESCTERLEGRLDVFCRCADVDKESCAC